MEDVSFTKKKSQLELQKNRELFNSNNADIFNQRSSTDTPNELKTRNRPNSSLQVMVRTKVDLRDEKGHARLERSPREGVMFIKRR